MANNIPMLEGTDAMGGYLVPDTYGDLLRDTILRESAAASLSKTERVAGKRQKYTVYAGRPVAGFTAEGAKKAVTGAGFTQISVDIKKITATVIYTEELLEDAREDPRVLVNADVEAAIADVIDAHELGMAGGAAVTTQFNSSLATTTSTVEIANTAADALPNAVSTAMGIIEANGGNPNGLILASDGRGYMRAARGPAGTSAAASPLLTQDGAFSRPLDDLWGLPIRFSSNLSTFAGAAAAGRVVGIVGDFTNAITAMRKDVAVRFTDQATLDVGGTLYHLWQQNEVAAQWETRVGFVVHDLNRMFVAIINAA